MNTINRMSRGVAAMARGVKPLLWPGEWREALARWFVLTLAGSLLATSIALHAWVAYATFGALLLASYATGVDPEAAEAQDELEKGEEGFEQDPFAYSPDEVMELLWDLKAHERGALLSQIREQLQAETGIVWGPQDIRALLADAGIAVRPGVRVRGVGNSTGVHRDDVPLPSSGSAVGAPVDVVGAGQAANANANNTTTARLLKDGSVVVSTPDEGNPHRTQVQMIPREGVSKA